MIAHLVFLRITRYHWIRSYIRGDVFPLFSGSPFGSPLEADDNGIAAFRLPSTGCSVSGVLPPDDTKTGTEAFFRMRPLLFEVVVTGVWTILRSRAKRTFIV